MQLTSELSTPPPLAFPFSAHSQPMPLPPPNVEEIPKLTAARNSLLEHNELWTGGPLPPIASSTYLPIADELAARARKPGAEEAQGLPWDVYVPTSLVQLRAAGQLPKWERNADGVWKSSPAV